MATLKRILDPYEELADSRLREVCGRNGARVFAKVRLADVFPIAGSRISDDHYRFALQSHFDFLVTDTQHMPLFALEYDGRAHQSDEQQKRDRVKDSLCERFELPLLRINANYLWRLYNGMDLLTWFIEVWFFWVGYKQAIETGELPPDEAFSPWAIISIEGDDRLFPLWLSRSASAKIQRLWEQGIVLDHPPQEIIVRCQSGAYRAIAYVGLTRDTGVMTQTAMRSQMFPIGDVVSGEAEAIGEIAIIELHERLDVVLRGEENPVSKTEFVAAVRNLLQNCEIVRSMYSGDDFDDMIGKGLRFH